RRPSDSNTHPRRNATSSCGRGRHRWHRVCNKTAIGWRSKQSPWRGACTMLRWAIIFLIIALIAGAMGFFRVYDAATQISWILFVIFLVLFLVALVFGGIRRPPA